MKIIRKTAIVMLLCLYFLTYGVLPQVQAAGKDAPVIVVAHRAGAKVAPENTVAALEHAFCHARGVAVHVALNTTVYGTELPALEQAIRDGAPIAEIDVQQLSDGTLIVMHDSNFKRTTGEDICVWDAEADALKTLEVGSGFSAAYRGEQIPTLEEMLACARGRITLMIELKYTGQENALEESVLTLLQDYDMVDECIIGSMNKGILQKMKELEPGISTVFIAHDLEEEDYELDYADSYSIEGRNLTVDMVDAIHYCGKSVYGWTANTSGAMLRIVNCGADGVITDDVRLLQTFLREQACRKAFASVY